MKTMLEILAVRRRGQLSNEAQEVALKNCDDMGGYAVRNSGFGQLHDKLREIDAWVGALNNDN